MNQNFNGYTVSPSTIVNAKDVQLWSRILNVLLHSCHTLSAAHDVKVLTSVSVCSGVSVSVELSLVEVTAEALEVGVSR